MNAGNNEVEGSRFTTWRLDIDSIQTVSVADNLTSSRHDWRPPELIKAISTNAEPISEHVVYRGFSILCNGQEEADPNITKETIEDKL